MEKEEEAREELGEDREEGVVLGLTVSGACGNAASSNCTVGLNLKYALYSASLLSLPLLPSSLGIKWL